jgi:hypothetical protein
MALLIATSGCFSKGETSLEEQFKSLMMQNQIDFDSVWHYEIKEDTVIVFYEKEKELSLAFIKNNKGKWEWIISGGSINLTNGGYYATAEMGLPYYITTVVTSNNEVKEVSVGGVSAKLVQVSTSNKLWFAFTDQPASGIDIEEIE